MQSHWGVLELLVTLKLPYLIVLQTQPPYKGPSFPQGSGQTSEPYRGCETHPRNPGWVSALPSAPEARSHLLLSLPSTSKQPQCTGCLLAPLRAAPQSFLPAAAPAKHRLQGRKGQMSRSAHDQQPKAQISPTAVMVASAFPQLLASLTAAPCHAFGP